MYESALQEGEVTCGWGNIHSTFVVSALHSLGATKKIISKLQVTPLQIMFYSPAS